MRFLERRLEDLSQARKSGRRRRSHVLAAAVAEALEERRLLSAINVIATFPSDTFRPDAILVDSRGDVYGATVDGGANSFGTVFEVSKGSSSIVTVASFNKT